MDKPDRGPPLHTLLGDYPNTLAFKQGRVWPARAIFDFAPVKTPHTAFKRAVRDLEFDEEETFELVGPGQENPEKGRILTDSPIGEGLIGKKKGEVAEIHAPKGTIRFKVLEISAAKID